MTKKFFRIMTTKFFRTMTTGFVLISIATFACSQVDKSVVDDIYAQIELFSYALTMIQSEYVENKTPQELIYGSLKGMLASLDPHSQFMDPDEYEELKSETSGKFGGLGIEISIRDGLLTIVTPIEGTPAWEAGIKAGDRIVKIEDEITKDITLNDAVKKLRGDPGTEVNITILREEEFKILDIKMTRQIIQVQDVKYPQILEDKIGFIRLTEFREDSTRDFKKALETLRAQGADSLILDLRNNPGGLLSTAIEISELFLPNGMAIVSTKGRRESQNMETFSKGEDIGKFLDWPMVVLINEGSASGSEIVAGALKDNKRAVILGTKSFGKGSVQSVLPLPDGSGLRLTTSKYFTPSGVSIHGTGIEPDIVVEQIYPEETENKEDNNQKVKEIFNKLETDTNGAGTITDSENKEAHDRLMKDNQVQSAMSVIKGIRVYKKLTEMGDAEIDGKTARLVEE
ncbi:MAG: S41 family peptidase [Candidatus Omnitrophota bacterium]